jgi:hypothetical protein
MGTTSIGQDVFSQLIWSTRQTVIVTLVVSVIATFLSTAIGVTAAYVGGVVDRILVLVIDIFLILPVLPLLILLASYLNPGVVSLIIVLCITGWAFQARQLRSQLALHHLRGDRADHDLAAGGIVPGAGCVRRRLCRQPPVPRPGQQQPADVGDDALQRPAAGGDSARRERVVGDRSRTGGGAARRGLRPAELRLR